MKRLIRVLAIVAIVAFVFSSCKNKEKCAAYSKVPVEQEISE